MQPEETSIFFLHCLLLGFPDLSWLKSWISIIPWIIFMSFRPGILRLHVRTLRLRMNPTLIRTNLRIEITTKNTIRSIDLGFPIYFPCIFPWEFPSSISPPMEIHGISGVGPVTTILRRPPFSTAWWPVVWLEPLRRRGVGWWGGKSSWAARDDRPWISG